MQAGLPVEERGGGTEGGLRRQTAGDSDDPGRSDTPSGQGEDAAAGNQNGMPVDQTLSKGRRVGGERDP